MELGLTFPLQRFLKMKTPPYGAETDRRFCWDLHVIYLQGRCCLLAVHCYSRYSFVRCDVSPFQWADLPGLFLGGLTESLSAGGFASNQMEAYLRQAEDIQITRTMAAGRWLFSTGLGMMCWLWIFAWTPPARCSRCWTMV